MGKVAVVMGSASDLPVAEKAVAVDSLMPQE